MLREGVGQKVMIGIIINENVDNYGRHLTKCANEHPKIHAADNLILWPCGVQRIKFNQYSTVSLHFPSSVLIQYRLGRIECCGALLIDSIEHSLTFYFANALHTDYMAVFDHQNIPLTDMQHLTCLELHKNMLQVWQGYIRTVDWYSFTNSIKSWTNINKSCNTFFYNKATC